MTGVDGKAPPAACCSLQCCRYGPRGPHMRSPEGPWPGVARPLEQQLDGRVKGLGHGDHDGRAEDPEDVVHKQPRQQDDACAQCSSSTVKKRRQGVLAEVLENTAQYSNATAPQPQTNLQSAAPARYSVVRCRSVQQCQWVQGCCHVGLPSQCTCGDGAERQVLDALY
jgi:hypothetical protein